MSRNEPLLKAHLGGRGSFRMPPGGPGECDHLADRRRRHVRYPHYRNRSADPIVTAPRHDDRIGL